MINDEDEATEEDSENIEEPVLVIPLIISIFSLHLIELTLELNL